MRVADVENAAALGRDRRSGRTGGRRDTGVRPAASVQGGALEIALLDAVAHDLRGSLAVIVGSADTLSGFRDSLSGAQQADLLQTIQDAAWELNQYLSGLLDARRLEAAAASPIMEPTDVRELVLGVANKTAQRCTDDRLALRMPRVVSVVSTDGALLEHALANLLDNALSYSPDEAAVDLAISEERDHLVIEVEDRGAGIAPSQLEEAFSRFRRLESGVGRSGGHGLGLSIARRFVEAVGGALEVVSPANDSGRGTRMIISLPKETLISRG